MVQIAGNAPPQGTVGDLYTFTFTATGDNPASQWVADGTLPSGLQLDAGTEWANYATPSLLLREGRVAEAREAVKRMANAPHYHRDLLEALLGLRPPAELDRMAHDAETSGPADPDPETSYYLGALFAYADKKEAAFHLLKAAIEQNYCAYSNLLSDPLLRGLHSDRQFDELLTAAHNCQQAVLATDAPPSQ